MNGSPASRYVSEEEANLRSVTRPPPNPFRNDNVIHTLTHHDNNDALEYGEHGLSNVDNSLEMIPLSDNKDENEESTFTYDNDNDQHDDIHKRRVPSSNAAFSGDDFHSSGTRLPQSLYQYIYPPNAPRSVQLFRPENIAVPACYLLVGLLQGLSGPFTNVYPLDLNASEAQQATISSLKSLPSTFKLAFGFLSDNVPLAGYRRKSYMLVGWAVTSLSMVVLLTFSDLSMEAVQLNSVSKESVNDAERYLETIAPESHVIGAPPSIPFLSFSLLMFGTGFWFADVMGDSIVAEKAKLEPESSRGQLQSTCYACRFFGLMVAAPFSTIIYSTFGPKAVVVLMAGLPASIVPLVYILKETKDVPVASTKEQCSEIWSTVCSRAVWQPMGFVYLYNVLQVGNAAWKQFLKTVLGFTSNQLNSLLIAAYVLLWMGIMAYKKFFISWSWRSVYVSTTLLNGVFSALQILLIKGITFGLSPFLFALGDDCFADFIGGIQFLPTTIMMVHLCPSGSEGASYAMFTTMSNSAYTLAAAFSTLLLGVWDVSKEAMERGELSGMVRLTALTTLIQVSGVLFVGLLPRTKEDLLGLHSDPLSGSKIGGFIFLFVTLSSVLYSLVVGVLNIVKPGWAGES
ncbi:hypothetical protein HJC23_000664 [Cyclotella cryptica]|uniref:Uncharacterized protein n=1 Tax=Cyclotella cryptica TaxID=29204 RepID=A0ABD3Q9A7_9STRA|eukprot:CCRYP_008073-RA/>CCRYP_008073-RA protein AED:0.05 eAED:0.05 QI:0/-1/0/1/-1/1/1/0/627